MREKTGRVKAMPVEGVNLCSIGKAVSENIETGSHIHTDEHPVYSAVSGTYTRSSVSHKKGEYSVNGVSTNGIESVWAVLRRGLYGVYHSVSRKHLGRYVNEFAFRLNEGNVKIHTYDRPSSLFENCIGARVTYKELINERREG